MSIHSSPPRLPRLRIVSAALLVMAAPLPAAATNPPIDRSTGLDFIGAATSGLALLSEGERKPVRLDVRHATFYVADDDQGCKPSKDRACRFTLRFLEFRVGAFRVGEVMLDDVIVRNERPIALQVKSTGAIPKGTIFDVSGTFRGTPPGQEADRRPPPAGATTVLNQWKSTGVVKFFINPAGKGAIQVGGSLSAKVAGEKFSLDFSISADTPLEHRPPQADAGPDKVVSRQACARPVVLDGSRSKDPDGEIPTLRWYNDDRVLAGMGPAPEVTLRRSGVNRFTLVATDGVGSLTTDTMSVKADCPPPR